MLRVITYSLLFALCLLRFAVPAGANTACKWVDTSGEASIENITPEEARQSALTKARLKAVEGVAGVSVQGASLVKNFVLLSDFIKAMTVGHVIEEKVTGWESKSFQEKSDVPPVTMLKVNLKSCVAASGKGDPFFKVKGQLNRPFFLAGEEAVINAQCTKDCWITVLNMTSDNRIFIISPNKYEPSAHIKADTVVTYPNSSGLKLEMQTLPGHKKDTEAFYLIATKEKFNLSMHAKKDGEISQKEFYTALLSLPPDTRTEEILLYEVREKD